MRRGALGATTLALALGLSLACGGGGGRKKAGKAAPVVVHPVGESAPVGDFTVTVHGSARHARVGGRVVNHAAPDGATLLVVDVSAENGAKKPQSMLGRFLLVDGDRTFNHTGACQIAIKDHWRILEAVNPGVERRGKICFEIPAGLSAPALGVKPGLLGKPIRFAVQ